MTQARLRSARNGSRLLTGSEAFSDGKPLSTFLKMLVRMQSIQVYHTINL
jgi:hypothetical protein